MTLHDLLVIGGGFLAASISSLIFAIRSHFKYLRCSHDRDRRHP